MLKEYVTSSPNSDIALVTDKNLFIVENILTANHDILAACYAAFLRGNEILRNGPNLWCGVGSTGKWLVIGVRAEDVFYTFSIAPAEA
jgi:hypothetical protein